MEKIISHSPLISLKILLLLLISWLLSPQRPMAQDSTVSETSETIIKPRPVTIFESQFIVDNQTVMVARKKVLNMAIQHRFGSVNNGKDDFFGIFGPANIRLALDYTPIENLSIGIGITKQNYVVDINAKYALLKQTDKGGWPFVSVSYFGNIAIDARKKEGNFVVSGDRLSYFNQLMIARKVSEKFSLQVSPSFSHFNNVPAYLDKEGNIQPKMNNDHFAIAFLGRYKLTERFHFIANYDQPLTRHDIDNPQPNICFGIAMTTISHSFQVFAANSNAIVPQYVNFYNQNNYRKGQFLIGFNITRRWNFN